MADFDLIALRTYLTSHYDLNELRDLCAVMTSLAPKLKIKLIEKIDADNIAGSTKTAFALSLVQFLERRNLLQLLIEAMKDTQAYQQDPFGTNAPPPPPPPSPPKEKDWTPLNIRDFMLKKLRLADVRPIARYKFPEIKPEIDIDRASLADLCDKLIDYCEAQGRLRELLTTLREANMTEFDKFAANLPDKP